MKVIVVAVCALACLTLANTKPCRGDTCRGYNNKGRISYGGGYSYQVGSNAGHTTPRANTVGGGTGSMDGSDYGYGGADNIWDKDGDDDMDGGVDRYDRYNGDPRNNTCLNCYVESIGRGGNNLNTIIIPGLENLTK